MLRIFAPIRRTVDFDFQLFCCSNEMHYIFAWRHEDLTGDLTGRVHPKLQQGIQRFLLV